jgi:hypothetical protein
MASESWPVDLIAQIAPAPPARSRSHLSRLVVLDRRGVLRRLSGDDQAYLGVVVADSIDEDLFLNGAVADPGDEPKLSNDEVTGVR